MDSAIRPYGAAALTEAVKRLQQGDIVAVPTETVYGLAGDSANAAAVAEIYRTKGRPDFNPLIVHVPDLAAAQKLGQFTPLAQKLAESFWPGPLTLIVLKTSDCPVSPAVTAGLGTIALRVPAHPVMQALLSASGLYLAAPSANKSGGISPTSASHVAQSLADNRPMILDGGPCTSGVESTIVAVQDETYQILRPGPVTAEQLHQCAGIAASTNASDKIISPGQLASHYAPSKPIRMNVAEAQDDEFHIGFGTIKGHYNLSAKADLAEAASRLFASLHDADASDFAKIAVAPIADTGIGVAINDRLKRATARS